MDKRESDPTGAFSGGGAAGTKPEAGREGGGQQPGDTPSGVDETEREVITSGTAATSEVGDRDAQDHAEGQGDGTPQPR